MRTQYVATIPLDEARLAKDLEQSTSFKFSEAYSNYLIGGPWKSAMLWSKGGDSGTGVLTNYAYDQQSTFTEYGQQMPYVQEIITSVADVSRLQFVRLAVFSDSVIVPHRDFLELNDVPEDERSQHRLHIPLVTHDACFFSEDNIVYRMRAGEVWYFDAAQIHSVASLSAAPRIHIIFDFAGSSDGTLVKLENQAPAERIAADKRVERPKLTDSELSNLHKLADLLTMDNFREVFSIVIKTHFKRDGGEDFAWNTMTAIARASKDPAVLPHTLELLRYYTLDRSGSKE